MQKSKTRFGNFLFGKKERDYKQSVIENKCAVCNGTGKITEVLLSFPAQEIEKDCYLCTGVQKFEVGFKR